jgi:ankyrin repeat protein
LIIGREAVVSDIFGWTPLHYACLAEDADGVFKHVLHAAKRNSKDRPAHKILDNSQRSAIHIAALGGNDDVLKIMLQELEQQDKTAVSLPGIDGLTPLHLATTAGDYDCVELLINAGHEQSTSDLDIWGREALHIAASYAHSKIASRLLKDGSIPDRKDKIGKSPLDYLLKDDRGLKDADNDEEQTEESKNRSKNKRSIFLELAKNVKAIKFQDENGKTFLHYAVEFADEGTIKELLQRGSAIEARDRKGRSPLHAAMLAGRTKIALGLINGSIEGAHANPAAKDRMGVTALMFASQLGLMEVATLLLERLKKADIQVRDDDGRTALHHAVTLEDDAMMKLMIDNGCDPTVRDALGRSALHDALIRGKDDFAVYLLEKKLQDDPKDKDGESLLIAACKYGENGCKDAVPRIIKEWPGIINDPDSVYGQTPLAFACENKHVDIVSILLAVKEVDPNLPADRWRKYTPFHFAVTAEVPRSINLLLDRSDVSLDLKDENDDTPLSLALDLGYKDPAKAILIHERTSDTVRIELLKDFCARPASVFHEIFADVLKAVNPQSLTADVLVELVEASSGISSQAVLETCFDRAIETGAWKLIKQPCLLAARVGRFQAIEKMAQAGADPTELDKDNWSCIDYAARYGHGHMVEGLSKLLLQHPMAGHKPAYAVPTALDIPTGMQENIIVGPCDTGGHIACKANCEYFFQSWHA